MSAAKTRETAQAASARRTIRLLALLAVGLWSAFYALPMPARLVLLPGLLSHLSIAARASRMEQGVRDAGRIQRVALVFGAGAAGLAILFALLMLGLGGDAPGGATKPRHALFATLAIVVAVVELWLAHAAKRVRGFYE